MATFDSRIQQLATSKQVLIEKIRYFQKELSITSQLDPQLDYSNVERALDKALQVIEAADPHCPVSWIALTPMLSAIHDLMRKVGELVDLHTRNRCGHCH